MNRIRTKLLILPLAVATMAPTCIGREGFDPKVPTITSFDFAPQSASSYDITWVPGPSYGLQFAHAKRFVLQLDVEAPPAEQRFNLQVMADGTKIGIIEAVVRTGRTNPEYTYRANAGAEQTPEGATDLQGAFWMACTSPKGKVRGNHGKDNNETASVHLRLGSDHSKKTPNHTVRCLQ